MISKLKKITNGMIVFSVLLSDYEKLDFKNDALAGVRANYFNYNYTAQNEKTELEYDDKTYNLSYYMAENEPLSWKITRNNRPYQTVKKATGGIYCVIVYGDNGIINKRQYFDESHNWVRTEYYDSNYENVLVANLYPKKVCGITVLCLEQIDSEDNKTVTDLYPSDTMPKNKCAGLVYSNCGMIWYDASFKPDEVEQAQLDSGENQKGFDFKPECFDKDLNACEFFDLDNAEYLEEVEIVELQNEDENTDDNSVDNVYSAYDKIEKILSEAHKSNKDLFGEILTQTYNDEIVDELSKENTDVDVCAENVNSDTVEFDEVSEYVEVNASPIDTKIESKLPIGVMDVVDSIEDDEIISSKSELDSESEDSYVPSHIRIEDETEPVEAITDEFDNDNNDSVYEHCENTSCDVVIHTKTGRFSYYGDVDENNCRTGRGRTVTAQGFTSYEGEYLDDKRHGFGVCYYKEGNINYVGNWDNGSRSGSGVGYRLSDGTMHAGKWNNNSPDGIGARFDSEGNFIDICSYANGIRDGKSISFDENGNVIIQKWENGMLISQQIITDEV